MITISHTRADGTLVEGTTRSDAPLLGSRSRGGLGLRWDDDNQRWYQRNSRNRSASSYLIAQLQERLTDAGHEVDVRIDNTTPAGPFADREAERYARADARAAAHDAWADNASARSSAAHRRVRQIADGIPFGQPILVGHHSERRARRDQARIEAGMRASLADQRRAEFHAGRANSAAAFQSRRENLGTTQRRIEGIEKRLRDITKILTGLAASEESTRESGLAGDPRSAEYAAELAAEESELQDQLAYWKAHVERQEAAGAKVWGPKDFAPGDFVRRSGTWFEVVRVNAKSVTIPAIVSTPRNGIVEAAASNLDWTDRLKYHEINDRRTREDFGLPARPASAPPSRATPARRSSAGTRAVGAPSLEQLLALAPALAGLLGEADSEAPNTETTAKP